MASSEDPPDCESLKRSMTTPPTLSDVRIILLGKSLPNSSRVGNCILGKSVFETKSTPHSVVQHSGRIGGPKDKRYITIIKAPHLHVPELSLWELNQEVKQCALLSNPGPHAFLLVVQPHNFSKEDGTQLKYILNSYSEEALNYSIVISTDWETDQVKSDAFYKLLNDCHGRHHRFTQFDKRDQNSVSQLLEEIDKMLKENGGDHLVCEIFEDAEEPLQLDKTSFSDCCDDEGIGTLTFIQHKVNTVPEGAMSLPVLNLVLCGHDGNLKAFISDCIMNQREQRSDPRSVCGMRIGEGGGYQLTLVEMPTLHNSQLSEENIMHETLRCVSVCDPGVHVFLFIISDISFTDEDKAEVEMIQRIFSSRMNNYTLFLINQHYQKKQLDKDDWTVIQSYGGRYVFFSANTGARDVIQRINELLNENKGSYFTKDMYVEAQIETQLKYKNEILQHLTHLKQKMLSNQTDTRHEPNELRIVLLGKSGVGKSSTGNTILRENKFKAEASYKSVTTVCQRETTELNERLVTVIDTPGLFGTDGDNDEVNKEIAKSSFMAAPGPHVFLLVLNLSQRITKEDKEAVKMIQSIFGEQSVTYTMVLFTGGDVLGNKSIEQLILEGDSDLMRLIEQCGNRYHLFNNNETRDPTQVTTLLDKIDSMVAVNSGHYSNEMFSQIEKTLNQEEHERILQEKERQLEKEKEELKDKYEAEIERLKKTLIENKQIFENTEQNYKMTVESLKIKESDLKEKLKAVDMELQDMKRAAEEERESHKNKEQNYETTVNTLKKNKSDLAEKVKTMDVELQNMKRTAEEGREERERAAEEERESHKNKEQNYETTVTTLKKNKSDLEEKLKTMDVELQDMKRVAEEERKIQKNKEKNYETTVNTLKKNKSDLEVTLKAMDVKLQDMKRTAEEERESHKNKEQDYETTVTTLKKNKFDLEEKIKTMNVELQDMKRTAEEEKKKFKTYMEASKLKDQEEQQRKAVEAEERRALEAKLKQAEEGNIQLKERLQEEKKNSERWEKSLNTMMSEASFMWQGKYYSQEREKEIQEIKKYSFRTPLIKVNKTELGATEPGLKFEEKIKTEQLLTRLHLLEKQKLKMKTSDVLQLTSLSLHCQEPCDEKDLVQTFLQRLLMMDYRARYITTKEETTALDPPFSETDEDEIDEFDELFGKKAASFDGKSVKNPIHPIDLQMAVFHCSDSFLKQLIVTKLSQCQYALPLLVPNPFTGKIEFPLWTFRQIIKSCKTTDTSGTKISKTQHVYEAETPMVAFFRLGDVSFSKSQLMNSLINEKHQTFFHRHCRGSIKNRLLMDGVVEIAWYCPSGKETDHFTDCVAFCNLHGDAETSKEQLDLLTEMSSVNVVLLSDPKNERNKEMLQKLLKDPKPLICLLSEDQSGISKIKNGNYRIGLKDRNQSDISKNLRTTITECLSKSSSVFKLENLYKHNEISTDEDDPECRKGKEAALEIIKLLEGKEISTLKETHLPCQGKLWHEWCQINKDSHRLQGNNLEMQKSEKLTQMKQIREQQQKIGQSDFIKLIVSSLNSLSGNEKLFFIKWFEILLNKQTSDDLSDLHHKYNETWTRVLNLKKKHDKSGKIKAEQTEPEDISIKLNAATFGLEHIFGEMGQIYESNMSIQTSKKTFEESISNLPKLAAELIKSGLPLELMDGDAAHVPLIWVSAVLDELIKKLGDQRVFVLSVLGIQRTGKSTMLNAMFGLQFAVSAGRCTRGAFMQLVRVSEEMKEQLKFDYVLIVDTEGLRALELAGKSTYHHDNELATFVVGLGNLTLINIFGENPAEMQEILQIVVQAFLRMKVKLNPRCMFVHQNVGDITAGEKNMEGRRRLQEKLDEMTKLAAKEEDSEAECFSDVIAFNVQDDVQYFAQLWEGSPPMAPQNPSYSENVQKLKSAIFTNATKSHSMKLSEFKSRISDLWKALLNENFVFSFKNTLEIAVYRKLETEFGKWTWSLRSAMLEHEEKLHNTIINRKLQKVEDKDLYDLMKKTREEVEKSMKCFFKEDKMSLIKWKVRCEQRIKQLLEDLVKNAKTNLNDFVQQQKAREAFNHKKTEYDEKLFNMSKALALQLKSTETDERVLRQEFDKVWNKWVSALTQDTPVEKPFDVWEDVIQILSEGNEQAAVYERLSREDYTKIHRLGDYSCYILKKSMLKQGFDKFKSVFTQDEMSSFEVQELVRNLINNVIQESEDLIKKICSKITGLGYKNSYIQEITEHVKHRVEKYHSENKKIKLKKEFTLDLCLHVCKLADPKFTKIHQQFRDENDVKLYLEKQKPQYYSIFQNYCRGATTTTVLGELVYNNLAPAILEAVYNKTAIDLSTKMRSDMPEFNGNRSQLEKHILKSLAEQENFEKYMEYVHHPKKHFEQFITENVDKYITENNREVLNLLKGNLKHKEQKVMNAVNITTEEVKKSSGDANMWLRSLKKSLTDELSLKEITCTGLEEITDLDFLQQVVCEGLTKMMSEQHKSINSVTDINMEKFRKKPDEILIEHLCQCCWVQCPFCKAICTNTMEDHDGDHSVPFHRVNGIIGWCYRYTTNLRADICTTAVQNDKQFYPHHDTDVSVPYKQYRTAGGKYAKWSITPDNSELTYWKWFVCRFQTDLEKYYGKTFQGYGEIPTGWIKYTKTQAIESLDKYI